MDEVKSRLREEGTEVARGHVRVDSSKALFKLRYRLSWAPAYVLDLVRAAVAAGAKVVNVRCDADDVELEHDGKPVSAETLRDLHVHAVGEAPEDLGAWLLATGLNCGLAYRPRWITVASGEAAARLGHPASLEVAPAAAPADGRTRIHLKHRARLAMTRFFSRKEELAALRRWARHAPVELRANGERLDREPLAGHELLARGEVKVGPLELYAGLTPARGRQGARLTVATYGVDVADVELPGLSPYLVAWARHDDLKLDASRSGVVADDKRYLDVLRRLRDLHDVLLGQALAKLDERRADITAVAVAGALFEPSKRALRLVREAPLFPGPSGEWVSLAALSATEGGLRVAFERLPAGSYDPPCVLMKPEPQAALLLPPARRIDIIEEVRARQRAEGNRRRFEAQPVEEARLSPGDDVARAAIDARDAAGEVALVRAGRGATVRFLTEGRLLAIKQIDAMWPVRLRAVIDMKSLRPSESYDDVARNDALKVALRLVAKTARRALLDRLATADPFQGPDAEDLRGHAIDMVAALAKGNDPLPDALRGAPLFKIAGGGHVSLALLADLADGVRVTDREWPHPPLDGKPVVVITGERRELLAGLVHANLVDATDRLLREAMIRRRLEGDKMEARIAEPTFVKVAVEGPGMRGELGVPIVAGEGSDISLRLLRDGVPICEKRIQSRYAAALAVVDCAALEPTPEWDDVLKETAAYRNVVGRVKDAEKRLVGALLEKHAAVPLDALPPPARELLGAFLRVELGGDQARARASGTARAALDAPLFRTLGGPLVSLAAVAGAGAPGDTIATLEPGNWGLSAPPGMLIVLADGAIRRILGEALGRVCVDAREEIPRALRRAELARQPRREAVLAVVGVLKVPVKLHGMVGEVAHRPGGAPGCQLELLLDGRPFSRAELDGKLATTAILDVQKPGLDPTDGDATRSVMKGLGKHVHAAENALLDRAAEEPDSPEARALLLEIFATGADAKMSTASLTRAQLLPLLPTTDGKGVSIDSLAGGEQRIGYVRLPLSAETASGETVVVATDPLVRRLLEARWPRRIVDFTDEMAAMLAARERQWSIPQVDVVRVAGEAFFRLPLDARGIEGEVALGNLAPRLHLHVERRPISEEVIDLPPGMAAAASCDSLVLSAGGQVLRDAAYTSVVEAVQRAGDDLSGVLAESFAELPEGERARLLPLAAAAGAWYVERGRGAHPICALPTLCASDGGWLSWSWLLERVEQRLWIWTSDAPGALADPAERVWRPRPAERELARRLSWPLDDATTLMAAALHARTRPLLTSLAVPVASPWREPIALAGAEGEVVVAERPSGQLVVELVRDGRLAELFGGEHPVGLVARVRCDGLRPTPGGQTVVRDDTFRKVSSAIDAALERLLVRLLAAGGEPAAAYARAAARWAGAGAGPVAEALANTPLFRDAAGGPVTLGRVRAEAAERGKVGVVRLGTGVPSHRPPRLLLLLTPEEQELLGELGVPAELLDAEAALAVKRGKVLALRREATESAGRALVVVELDDGGWRGRLLLARGDRPEDNGLIFVRDGLALDEIAVGHSITGVIENVEAPLEPDGLLFRLSDAARHQVSTLVDRVFAALAETTPDLPPARRGLAAFLALRWLGTKGIDGAGEIGDRLSRAPLFQTASSRWIDLRSLVEHATRRGAIDVVPEKTDEPAGMTLLGPRTGDPPWLEALAHLLGSAGLVVHPTIAAWQRARRDAEPEPDSPLYHGLARLRAEVELLRAGAFARLGPGELARIGLRRDGGASLCVYDPEKAAAMLDPEHPAVAAALAEAVARPDRLYVLLALVFGVVNRWLERVTDEDEATACGALLEHLAANPAALEREP